MASLGWSEGDQTCFEWGLRNSSKVIACALTALVRVYYVLPMIRVSLESRCG